MNRFGGVCNKINTRFNYKNVVKLNSLETGKKYVVVDIKKVTTRYGDAVVLESETFKTYLPKRMVDVYDDFEELRQPMSEGRLNFVKKLCSGNLEYYFDVAEEEEENEDEEGEVKDKEVDDNEAAVSAFASEQTIFNPAPDKLQNILNYIDYNQELPELQPSTSQQQQQQTTDLSTPAKKKKKRNLFQEQ